MEKIVILGATSEIAQQTQRLLAMGQKEAAPGGTICRPAAAGWQPISAFAAPGRSSNTPRTWLIFRSTRKLLESVAEHFGDFDCVPLAC